ncbi:MAG TPA: 4-hydroxythreonine-4-phosphate dehydrogenase PdxA, partial [Rhodocyclaceae bacterium]|nr:4-hydroxythreonine-4-phosphate dehydrogenase PdxA [Rhodocyclaceae bacterium]
MSAVPTLAITSGEPAGVGPELCARLAMRRWPARLVVIGDRALLASRLAAAGCGAVQDYRPDAAIAAGTLEVVHVPLRAPAEAGRLDAANAAYVLETLDRAIDVVGFGIALVLLYYGALAVFVLELAAKIFVQRL